MIDFQTLPWTVMLPYPIYDGSREVIDVDYEDVSATAEENIKHQSEDYELEETFC